MYILILEDDPFLSYDLHEALSSLNDDVRDAATVQEAFALVHSEAPQLAILDYDLRHDTSARVAVWLARENVPFCYVTADAERVRSDPSVPDCPIVSKPYRLEEVTELAAALMKRDGHAS